MIEFQCGCCNEEYTLDEREFKKDKLRAKCKRCRKIIILSNINGKWIARNECSDSKEAVKKVDTQPPEKVKNKLGRIVVAITLTIITNIWIIIKFITSKAVYLWKVSNKKIRIAFVVSVSLVASLTFLSINDSELQDHQQRFVAAEVETSNIDTNLPDTIENNRNTDVNNSSFPTRILHERIKGFWVFSSKGTEELVEKGLVDEATIAYIDNNLGRQLLRYGSNFLVEYGNQETTNSFEYNVVNELGSYLSIKLENGEVEMYYSDSENLFITIKPLLGLVYQRVSEKEVKNWYRRTAEKEDNLTPKSPAYRRAEKKIQEAGGLAREATFYYHEMKHLEAQLEALKQKKREHEGN